MHRTKGEEEEQQQHGEHGTRPVGDARIQSVAVVRGQRHDAEETVAMPRCPKAVYSYGRAGGARDQHDARDAQRRRCLGVVRGRAA